MKIDRGRRDRKDLRRNLTDHLVEREREPVWEPRHHVGVGDRERLARKLRCDRIPLDANQAFRQLGQHQLVWDQQHTGLPHPLRNLIQADVEGVGRQLRCQAGKRDPDCRSLRLGT